MKGKIIHQQQGRHVKDQDEVFEDMTKCSLALALNNVNLSYVHEQFYR